MNCADIRLRSTLAAALACISTVSAVAISAPEPAADFEILSENSATPLEKRAATACCASRTDCNTVSGTNSHGDHWCYGYWSGNKVFSQAEADVSKCLSNLHHESGYKCISVAGSRCAQNTDIFTGYDARLYDNSKFSDATNRAIKSAIQAAVGQKFDPKSDVGSDGYIEFSHVADNGSGIRAMQIYTTANKVGC